MTGLAQRRNQMNHSQLPVRYQRPSSRATVSTTLLFGLALGAIAGLVTYGLWSAQGDRDGLVHRPPDDARGRNARRRRFGRYAVTGRTVTIDRPRAEVYDYWRDFSNLPTFMENVRSVVTEGGLTRWTIRGPGGRDVALETRLVNERPGEQIAWRSTENSQIDTEGKVLFRDARGGRGTEVEAIVAYVPPAGEIGRLIAKLFQAAPAIQGRRELKRLKMMLETGEIATSQNRNAT
jgi:uncharacterized membrane protein